MQRLAAPLDCSAATFEPAIAPAPQVPGGALGILAAVHDEAAETTQYRGDAVPAERYLRALVAIDERAFGPGDGRSSNGLRTLASFLASEGRYAEAFPIFAEGRRMRDRLPQKRDCLSTHTRCRLRDTRARLEHGQLVYAMQLREEVQALPRDPASEPNIRALTPTNVATR